MAVIKPLSTGGETWNDFCKNQIDNSILKDAAIRGVL